VADQNQRALGDIEVTMVESHANLKILSKKRPGQLLKLMVGLQNLRLSILHLNVTTVDQMVLYSVSVKVSEFFSQISQFFFIEQFYITFFCLSF
jgi:myogenic factor 6